VTKSLQFSIVVAAIIAVLLIGFLPNDSFFFIFVKLLLSLVLGIGAYTYIFKIEPSNMLLDESLDEPHEDENNADLPTATSQTWSSPSQPNASKNVESYFEDFLQILLPTIRQTTVSDSAALLMVNYFKKQFYIRAVDGINEESSAHNSNFALNLGLPAIVFKEKKALLENNLPEGSHVIPYRSGTNPAHSFMAAPIIYNDYVIAVICVDSHVAGSYSEEDLALLKNFADLIQIQMNCSNQLYDYETANRTTKMLYDFTKQIHEISSLNQLWQYVDQALRTHFNADITVLAERAEPNQVQVIYASDNSEFYPTGQSFPDNEGLFGWVLRNNESMLVEDFSAKVNYIPRMHLEENPITHFKSLLAVPIIIDDEAQMVLSVESRRASQFDEQHKRILEAMATQIAGYLDTIRKLRLLQKNNFIDTDTGLDNLKALKRDLEREIYRSKKSDKIFCLQVFKIYSTKQDLDSSIVKQLYREFIALVRPQLPSDVYLYKISLDTFAFLWPETVMRDAVDRFQKIYRYADQKRPWANGLVDKIYLNSGLVEYPQMGTSVDELLENAQQALRKSELRGPNSIDVYEIPREKST
jgi:GAF domain-containing protein